MRGTAPTGWKDDLREMFREQRRYREVLSALVRRGILVRYKQTLLGFGWALLVPVLQMLVFTVVFTRAVPMETDLPYPIYAYVGLLPWTLFAGSVRSSAGSLVDNARLVTNVYFPREMFPFSAVLIGLVDFLLASGVLALLMVVYGVSLSWTAFLVPFVLGVQLAFTAGVGLVMAMANLFYRDVRHVTGVLLTVWMFATSVVYPVDRVGGRLGQLLSVANPMTPIIEAYRSLLLRGELPPPGPFLWATGASLGALMVAWTVFHRAEFRFAERI